MYFSPSAAYSNPGVCGIIIKVGSESDLTSPHQQKSSLKNVAKFVGLIVGPTASLVCVVMWLAAAAPMKSTT